AFTRGSINAFDLPARQAMLPELLDSKADLSNAIALNSSLFNAARLVGPALAGVVVELGGAGSGEGWCFLVNGVSFLGVLVALGFVKLRKAEPAVAPAPFLTGLREGLDYAGRHK